MPAESARHYLDYLFLMPKLLLDIGHPVRRASLQAFIRDPAGYGQLAASLRQCVDEFHGVVEEAFESPATSIRTGNYQVDLDDAGFVRQVEHLQTRVRADGVLQIVLLRSSNVSCTDP